MNGHLSDEATEAGEVVRETLANAGGVNILRRAVDEPQARVAIGELLQPIGLWELSPRSDELELEVAATASRAAGRFGLPYPVAERLGSRAAGAGALALVAEGHVRAVSHIDLPLEWAAVDLRGRVHRIVDVTAPLGSELAPFAHEVVVEATGEEDARGASLVSVLHTWWLLGLLEAALDDTVQYTREREQFGRALIKFQSVGFQLADAAVAVEALREHAKYALWTLAEEGSSTALLAEAVALRLAAQRAAGLVMRTAHQLHGAMGFTNEVDISWLSRASQSTRRLPEGEHRTASLLTDLIRQGGWRGFGEIATAPTGVAN